MIFSLMEGLLDLNQEGQGRTDCKRKRKKKAVKNFLHSVLFFISRGKDFAKPDSLKSLIGLEQHGFDVVGD